MPIYYHILMNHLIHSFNYPLGQNQHEEDLSSLSTSIVFYSYLAVLERGERFASRQN